jgi:Ca-activated chloride channel homolog
MKTHGLLLFGLLWLALTAGCSSDAVSDGLPSPNGSMNVTQGGAQDFAQFRKIIEEGGVPASDLLDPVGFLAEHAMDLPPANCGQSVCIHPSLAVAPRFNGGNWTMAFVAMNTPIDPADLERPPLHLVVAIDQTLSGYSNGVFDGMLAALRAEDRLTIVTFGATAAVVGRVLEPSQVPEALAYADAQAKSQVANLYDALATARSEIHALDDHAGRVLLLTTGRADAGIGEPEHIIALGEKMASEAIALGVVGFGSDYDATITAELGSLGAGTYSFAGDSDDLAEVLTIEGETALYPLATSFTLRIEPAPGYHVGRIYGVKRAFVEDGAAVLEMPALFIGQRSGATDVGGSRRGGGGGLFVELIADAQSGVGAGQAAFLMTATYTDAGGAQSAAKTVINELSPGANPATMWPFFSEPSQDKPFMVLNMYLAFKASVELFEGGDCAGAMGVTDMMSTSVEGWQGAYADPDIADDYNLLQQLRENIAGRCVGTSARPPVDFGGGCMFI